MIYNIKELKNSIENKNLDDSFFILKYSDSIFIAKQYIEEIARFKNKNINYVESLSSVKSSSNNFFGFDDNELNVIICEVFKEFLPNYNGLSNTILVCKTIDESVNPDIDKFIIEIPSLAEWQINSYAKMRAPGLKKEQIEWLCKICSGNIYRLNNELDKISIFGKGDQEDIFTELNNDNAYVDLNPLQIFDFTNAFLKKDYNMIKDVLSEIENIDVEPAGLLTILCKNFKNVIKIQLNPKATAESLNMSSKQFNAIKWNCNKYSNTQLIDIYEMLTTIDLKLKSGILPYENIVEYITINILK